MIHRFIFVLIVLNFQLPVWSQDNLVANGNFNESLACSGNTTIAHWFIPQNNPVDIDNLCPYIDWWRFIRDPKMGIQGSACGFVETYYKGFADDNIYSGRLYMATKLTKPLQAGQQYYFEMMVRAVDTFPNLKLVNTVFTNGQDISFAKEMPLFDFDIPRNFLTLRPVVTSTLKTNYEWHKISHCFRATGNEHYLIIGNFRNDANTDTATTKKRNPNFPNGLIANYAIDNVILTPMNIQLTDTSFCQSTLVINAFTSYPKEIAYQWSDGSTAPQYTATKNETIALRLKYSDQCFLDKSIQILALSKAGPGIMHTKDTTFCEGDNILISGGIHLADQTITWDDGSTVSDRNITAPGTYTSLIGNKCGLSITQKIYVKTKSCDSGLFLPNIFTPNADGVNDEFKPFFSDDFREMHSMEFSIFNRWGQLIYFTRDSELGWDGMYLAKPAPSGVYGYQLLIKTKTATGTGIIRRQGDLTLVRP